MSKVRNILYILQQSVYNNDGKWISADSNINMACGILRELLDKTDWNFYVLIGRLEDFADISSYEQLISYNEKLKWIPYPFPVDAFLNRQNFNVVTWNKMFHTIPNPDIIWNNITELSRNIKTYCVLKKIPVKFITSCYWLDLLGEAKIDPLISYQWRQFDGFQCSDIATFTCKSTRDAWAENSKYIFNDKYIKEILKKSVIWDFGFSSKELDQWKCSKNERKIVMFLNRLSGINYTHHNEFIEATNILFEMRKKKGKQNDYTVVFTNPSQKISWDELRNRVKNIYLIRTDKTLSRREYVELLWEGRISVHLYDLERMGGCANTESIYCDNIAVMPDVYEYKRRGGEAYPFYLRKKFDPIEIAEKLDKALDSNFVGTREHLEMKQRNSESAYEYVSDIVIRNIEEKILLNS